MTTPDGRMADAYRLHSRRVRSYIGYRIEDYGRAEDLTQDVFAAAMRNTRTDTVPDESLRAWLLGIARIEVLKYLKFDCRERPRSPHSVTWDQVPDDTVPFVNNLDEEDRAMARQALAELDDDEREIVFCRYGLGMSTEATSITLRWSKATVKALSTRGLEYLRHVCATAA